MIEQTNQEPDPKTLKQFGYLLEVFVVIFFWGVLPWWLGTTRTAWPWFLSGGVLILAFIAPTMLLPVYRIWMKFAGIIGLINTRVILFIVFFAIFFPLAVLMRLFGRDVLRRKAMDRSVRTFRVPSARRDHRHFERPY
ncbi:MAG: SxtJ family membrane protein [Pseudomonadales bacterium]